MKLARFRSPDDAIWAGAVEDDEVIPLLPGDGHGGAMAVVDLAMAHRRGELGRIKRARPYRLDEVRLLPPVPSPGAVRDFLAFEEHVRNARRGRGLDVDPGWYEIPVFYFTNPHTILGPDDPVPHPRASQALDYELEVAAVVGQDGTDLDPDEAAASIAGYTVFDDFSARDVQMTEMAQLLGPAKGKDFANAFGPWLVTPDELEGGEEGRPSGTMVARVNGTETSRGELSDCHWSFGEMIAYASRDSKVRRGDLIGSGTVGTGCLLELRALHGEDRHPWLRPGDVVELTVDGIGMLRNPIAED